MYTSLLYKNSTIVGFYFLLLTWFLVILPFLENINYISYYLYFTSVILLGSFTLMPLILTKKINKNVKYFFLVGCLFILKDVFILDISGILDQINFFFGILITYISAKYLPMHRGNIKFVMMMYIFYLLVFTAIIRPESVSFSFNSARFFIANVHGYGLSFVFIFLVYLYAFNIRSTPANLKHIAALSLIAILIIATGSRTAIYTSIFILTSLFFERFKPFQNNIFRFFVAFVFFIGLPV